MKPEKQDYRCDVCGGQQPWECIVWLTSSYRVCETCCGKMTEEEKAQAIEDFE